MRYLKKFDTDKLKIKKAKHSSEDSLSYNFYYKNEEIGHCLLTKDKKYFTNKGYYYHNLLTRIKLKNSEWYLIIIQLNDRWCGKNIGIKFLNKIMKLNNISGLYLVSHSNHPLWDKISSEVSRDDIGSIYYYKK